MNQVLVLAAADDGHPETAGGSVAHQTGVGGGWEGGSTEAVDPRVQRLPCGFGIE